MSVEEVLGRLAERGTHLTFDGRLEGGEFETYAVVDGDGTRWVLKAFDGKGRAAQLEAVARRVDRLRSKGYPAPARGVVVDIDGAVAFLQEFVPGKPADEMSHALLDRVLELSELQSAASKDEPSDWRDFMRTTLVEGLDTWSRHDTLRDHNDETRALVADIESIGRAWPGDCPVDDLVHLDFSHRNLLRDEAGRLTAVVDWEGIRPGDRHLDLVTLAFALPMATCERGVEDRLWEHLRATVSAENLLAYVAHMAVRLVDYIVRAHPAYVDSWVDISRHNLDRATT